jgi:class 3 adenylate cyclase
MDFRSDLFSVGVLLYEAATAHRLFEGVAPSLLRQEMIAMRIPPPSDLAPDLPLAFDRIVLRCLAADPDQRFQSVAELQSELQALQGRYLSDEWVLSSSRAQHSEVRETERRRATIVMGELQQSTPEQGVRDVLTNVVDTVARHGGTVDRVSGSSFVAFFGLPSASEHSTRNAIKACLAIRDAAHGRAPDSVVVRLALSTGNVLAGSIGSGTQRRYAVSGEAADVAEQILKIVLPGHVYVSAATEAEARRDFLFEPVHSSHATESPVFDVAGVQRDCLEEMPGLLLGRDEELKTLMRAVAALRAGEGQVIMVSGDAGIGKSHLIGEITARNLEGVTLLSGRAASEGQHLGYHLMVDLLKRWASIQETDSRAVAQQKLETLLVRVSGADSTEQLPFIASLLGLSPDADTAARAHIGGDVLAKLTLRHLRALLSRAAAMQPTLVCLEDLHWADQSSIELLESLFKLVVDHHRIAFVITCRSGYAETSGRLIAACRARYASRSLEIELRPLDMRARGELLDACVGAYPVSRPLRERLVQRSGGNPYFMREMAASVIAGSGASIPETLEELLIARVDRLPERERGVLKQAAVIGETFGYRTLEAVATPGGSVKESLELLQRKGFLGTRQSGGDLECYFVHALMQEAVYRTLAPATCRELHLSVAAAIERLFAERLNEFYGVLAHHYTRAAIRDKAEGYLEKAGAEALKSSASSEAIHYFQQALTAYLEHDGRSAHPDRKAHFECNIAIALFNKGRMVEAADHFDRALTHWNAVLPRGKTARAIRLAKDLLKLFVRLYVRRTQPARAASAREIEIISTRHKKGQAVVTFDASGYFVEAVAALGEINRSDITTVPNGPGIYSSVSALFSIPGISFTVADRILKYTRPFIRDEDWRALIQYRLSEIGLCMVSGRWKDVPPLDLALVEKSHVYGDHWFLWVYLYFYATLLTELGRYDELEHVQELLARIADYYSNDLVQARRALVAARASLKQGRCQTDDLTNLKRALPAIREVRHLSVYAMGLKARLELTLGDVAAAEDSLRSGAAALSSGRRIPPFYLSGYRIAQLEYILADRRRNPSHSGLIANEKRIIKDALDVSRKNALDRAEILRLVAMHAWHTGDRRGADRLLRRSIIEGRTFGAMIEVARGERLLAEHARPGE